MSQVNTSPARRTVRTFLVLGRVSNLPTVFSNCIAGWWLGGHESVRPLPFLLAGAAMLYVGGMFLNDAFDADFDQRHRTERPVPSGAISLASVWRAGWLMMILGWASFLATGAIPAAWGLALVGCIVLYNAVHKRISWSPVLMGLCRFLLYLSAASTSSRGITVTTAALALAILLYIVGLSYLARRESTSGAFQWWPLLCLGSPVVLAILLGYNGRGESAYLLAAVLALYIARSIKPLFFKAERNIGRTVAALLAGIVLVDWVAIADAPREFGFGFVGLLFAALFLQRSIPAT